MTYHPYWKCAVRYSAEVIDGAPDWHEDLLHHVTPSLMSIVLRPGNHHVICQYKNPFIRRWVLYCLLWYSSLWWWKKYSFTCGANVVITRKSCPSWSLAHLEIRKEWTDQKQQYLIIAPMYRSRWMMVLEKTRSQSSATPWEILIKKQTLV